MRNQVAVPVGGLRLSNADPFALIAGPCQIESMDHALQMAHDIATACQMYDVPFIYKSSYDKANRTSGSSERGVGLAKGLHILEEVRRQIGCPVTTDIHTTEEAYIVGHTVDMVQIPALLSRQTDLLNAAGLNSNAVNIKKGQFMAPEDMRHAAQKVMDGGCRNVLLTERGSSFGYGRLVNDMRALRIMSEEGFDLPVCYDATHSVQLPSSLDGSSGGQRQYVPALARAAVAFGVGAIFIETHEDPDNAPSDGPCMLPLSELPKLLRELSAIDREVKRSKDLTYLV